MANKSGATGGSGLGGGARKPTGQASPAKSSGGGRGFTPTGAKSTGRSGSQVKRAGGTLKTGPKSGYAVEGK